ncbi:pyrophosphate-energized vacuolar membrane proton pump-like [Rhododendron vialii]|uniref:pyrophosphate-energized vacuolar membrane proton pump-like n=1 Tax=Rhododendron vialii TaxID=182163 RepID=UPI00265F3E23|nr:pyrophosphate-energized vacuolar membrane proton pump-like [Rhododendron vialii]
MVYKITAALRTGFPPFLRQWRSHFRKEGLFESVMGFSLGWSSMVLFGRVVQKRAADVGADIVGMVEQNIPEDDPRIER